jgi:hypothetical protein
MRYGRKRKNGAFGVARQVLIQLARTIQILLSGVSLASPPEPAALPPGIVNSDEAEIRAERATYNNALGSRNSGNSRVVCKSIEHKYSRAPAAVCADIRKRLVSLG